jgi:hypothetical protein
MHYIVCIGLYFSVLSFVKFRIRTRAFQKIQGPMTGEKGQQENDRFARELRFCKRQLDRKLEIIEQVNLYSSYLLNYVVINYAVVWQHIIYNDVFLPKI